MRNGMIVPLGQRRTGESKMIRRIALIAVLFLAAVALSAFVANAVGGHYALDALEGMAADACIIEQEIQTVEEIFQEYGVEVPDKFRRTGEDQRPRADLTDEQRAAIREKVAEMKEAGVTRKEIRTTVKEMLEGYGIEVPHKEFRHSKERGPDFRDRNSRKTLGNPVLERSEGMADL
jgi:hypothetical protein